MQSKIGSSHGKMATEQPYKCVTHMEQAIDDSVAN
jgi:hypothetical protein